MSLRSPRWKIADKCVDCSTFDEASVPEPSNAEPAPIWTLIKNDTCCDGIRFDWSPTFWENYTTPAAAPTNCPQWPASAGGKAPTCFKLVVPYGHALSQMSATECAYAAATDPECSDIAFRTIHYGAPCFCYRKHACCGQCVQRSERFASLYRVPRLV